MTNFSNAANVTDKTDKTIIITNDEFLEAIFENSDADARPIIASFPGHPKNGTWTGYPWQPNDPVVVLPNKNNNYFTLASFNPNKNGKYKRQKALFCGLHAVFLDDIGTKVDLDRINLPLSWLIETSPGNYQGGYILENPIHDTKKADQLVKAIIQAELCDPGASGPTTRYARLPVAVHGKTTPPFSCRLTIWEPNKRYSVDDLVNGLELDMSLTDQAKRKSRGSKARKPDAGEEIYIPCPDENAVIAAIKDKGLYKKALGDGKHDMTCPWVHEHTDKIDSGTAYFEPNDNYPIGGFKCLHGHCENRHIRELLEFLDIDISLARMKPVIRCIGGRIHNLRDVAEQELATRGRYYQRGGLIVTIVTDPTTKEVLTKEVSIPALTIALSSVAAWESYNKSAKDWVPIDPPTKIVTALYDSSSYQHLPVLNGITNQPYLRPDGTLMSKAGHDKATGLFGVFNTKKFDIPDEPTKEDAKAALTLVSELLSEFSFATEADKTAALSAILTAAIRLSLILAPMFHVRAPQISSGKTFLCAIIGAFATPRQASPTTFPRDDEECRKLLLSEFLRAPAVIEFDNLTGDLVAHKSLCAALTSEFLKGRILGVSKTASVSTRALFLSSGNNVGPVQDMTRRCLTINLDPACENPASRVFKNPTVLSDLHRDREKYVTAALTIIRAWIVAGRPMSECRPLTSFEEWSNLCRQPLMWLGLPDPTEPLFEAMSDDPDQEMLGRLLRAWYDRFGNVPTMIRDAVDEVEYEKDMGGIFRDIAEEKGTINRRRLGRWIKRYEKRIVGGLRFVKVEGSRSASAWKVEEVS